MREWRGDCRVAVGAERRRVLLRFIVPRRNSHENVTKPQRLSTACASVSDVTLYWGERYSRQRQCDGFFFSLWFFCLDQLAMSSDAFCCVFHNYSWL